MTWPVGHGLLVQTLAQDGLTSDFLSPPAQVPNCYLANHHEDLLF